MLPKAWSTLILLQSVALAAWFLFASVFVGIAEAVIYRDLLQGKPLPAITELLCSIHHPQTGPPLMATCLFLATSHWLVGTLFVCSPKHPEVALPRWLFFSTCSWGILFVYSAFLLCVLLMPCVTILQTLEGTSPEMLAARERKEMMDLVYTAGAALYALAALVCIFFRLKPDRPTRAT